MRVLLTVLFLYCCLISTQATSSYHLPNYLNGFLDAEKNWPANCCPLVHSEVFITERRPLLPLDTVCGARVNGESWAYGHKENGSFLFIFEDGRIVVDGKCKQRNVTSLTLMRNPNKCFIRWYKEPDRKEKQVRLGRETTRTWILPGSFNRTNLTVSGEGFYCDKLNLRESRGFFEFLAVDCRSSLFTMSDFKRVDVVYGQSSINPGYELSNSIRFVFKMSERLKRFMCHMIHLNETLAESNENNRLSVKAIFPNLVYSGEKMAKIVGEPERDDIFVEFPKISLNRFTLQLKSFCESPDRLISNKLEAFSSSGDYRNIPFHALFVDMRIIYEVEVKKPLQETFHNGIRDAEISDGFKYWPAASDDATARFHLSFKGKLSLYPHSGFVEEPYEYTTPYRPRYYDRSSSSGCLPQVMLNLLSLCFFINRFIMQ